MAYRVISDFKDLLDNGYLYKAGDTYPHSGTPDESRVKMLMAPTKQRGGLIEFVTDEKPTPKRKKEK